MSGGHADRHLRLGTGIVNGFKFIAWNHLVLEASMGLDVNLATAFRSGNREFDWMGIPALKAGYRF